METGGPAVYSDDQAIAMARRGDVRAFARIVETHKSFLFTVVVPIVGSEDAAEDVLQETFLQIYRSLPRYEGGGFRSWAARIAVNKAIDHRRARQRALQRNPERGDEQRSAEEEALERMGLARIALAVRTLTPALRRTFVKFYVEGLSCVQLAKLEGVSARTIESRLYRARQLLKRELRSADEP